MDWLDLLAVQGTLKSLLQYRSSKASILWSLAFIMVQLSHPSMTTAEYKYDNVSTNTHASLLDKECVLGAF